MISSLRGRLAAKDEDYITVEVGGLGFKVYVPTSFLRELGSPGHEVALFTHLHLRENDVSLYGFKSQDELTLFKLLLGVSGIGPKLALAILSTLSVDDFRFAVAHGDVNLLSEVPGIGKRLAERVILYLKDKIAVERLVPLTPISPEDAEVVEALTALGYSLAEAREAVSSLADKEMTAEDKVMAALRYLGGG